MKQCLKRLLFWALERSVKAAVRAQHLDELYARLEKIVPDISDQYSFTPLDTSFWLTKVRAQHAFQMAFVGDALKGTTGVHTVVDIGDSSGTHLRYITELFGEMRTLSVNLDRAAVERIKGKGLEAVHMRAEELAAAGINADLFLSFETLEHISDPASLMHSLAVKTEASRLAITVPYMRRSRVGLVHIRDNTPGTVTAEAAHIFELSPEDWKLLALHAGWRAVSERTYLQYPRFGLWRITARWWRRRDFEGFYGMVLERDDTWSSAYTDWQD